MKVLWYFMIPLRRHCTILDNNTVPGTSIHTGRCKHMVDMIERSIETNRFLRRISMEEKNWCVPFERRTDWYKGTFHTSRSTVLVTERLIRTNDLIARRIGTNKPQNRIGTERKRRFLNIATYTKEKRAPIDTV